MFDLNGKVVVVTGGNGGIGLGLARGVAKAGADVAIWARNPDKNRAAVDELRRLGCKVEAWTCDISSQESVDETLAATIEAFGAVHVCFANAGFGSWDPFRKMSRDSWDRVLATNLTGTMQTLQSVSRHMVERGGGGKLIVISSIVENFGAPTQVHYAACKGGLGAMVRSLAVDLARHDIQVNAIQPGWIVTDPLRPATENEEFTEVIMKRTPARRWGDPADFEGVAVYLAADESRFHTGDTICIDGGYSVF